MNIFKDDTVIHFTTPKGKSEDSSSRHYLARSERHSVLSLSSVAKRTFMLDMSVQASIPANTYVISGPSQNKKLQEMLPGILNQLGADNLANLQKLAQQYQGQAAAAAAAVRIPPP